MSFKPIAAAISISLALFLLLFMVWPKYQELQDINQQVKEAETQLEEGKEYVAELEELSGRLEEREQAVSKVEASLPSRPDLPSFLNFLQETSSNQGLMLRRVGSISQGTYQGDIKQVDVNLVLVGSYTAFRNFVRAVEKSSRIVEVKQVTFEKPKVEEDEESPPQFEVKLSTHYYNPQ